MFDWFKKRGYSTGDHASDMEKIGEDMNKVIPFPELKAVPAPAPEPPAKIFYRLGITDNNRVAFSMGHMEITMTKLGCQQMIDQIEVFMNQLNEDNE